MVAEIIDGNSLAGKVRRDVKKEVRRLRAEAGVTPALAVILVGDDQASKVYVAAKEKAAREADIKTASFNLPGDSSQEDVLKLVRQINDDPKFHGILVQLPLPAHLNTMSVISSIEPAKDVDGLHPTNMGLLLMGVPLFVPCTPAGIQYLLMASGHSPDGKHMVICGRSQIVGRPLAALMLRKELDANATVTICHTGTQDLAEVTRRAEILVVATDSAGSITGDMVKRGAVVVDVGIHRIPDPKGRRGYRLVGDVDFDSVKHRAGAITPVPGGVGPMTVAMLLVNTIKAARLTIDPNAAQIPALAGR